MLRYSQIQREKKLYPISSTNKNEIVRQWDKSEIASTSLFVQKFTIAGKIAIAPK